jgi:hypothetical protein
MTGPMNFHRLRGNWKALSAALGVGVLVTMGAVTLAHPTMEADTSSDSWKAEANITLIPATRVLPSFAPTLIADPCTWAAPHARAHHLC